MPSSPVNSVRLRPVTRDDFPALYEHQIDPAACEMAAVRPRTPEDFETRWSENIADPTITARVIEADGKLVGSISCFEIEGEKQVGYWIDRAHWGRGIATRALGLFLGVVPDRPLNARVATANAGSLRVLERCGFVETKREWCPEEPRYPACEVAFLILR